ncbi:hypothetical protein [Plantactinospora sp. KBS50]|uniref:hypothetical protein n=1 Tax=Plantactinospora sp. KBS50 TaxID=2024580 RepID=UPI000BAB1171|nr:hypothetical protein [Plantactinospora sp. KBS50]ASW56157.1 hypothetical protein CIK06_21325 [Plantactinospora sp. KBS50]
MVGRVRGPVILTALVVAALGAVLGGARPAQAAPKPTPTTLTVTPEGDGDPVSVRSDQDSALFATLLDQVSWLRAASGQGEPSSDTDLGRKYTVLVTVGDEARQTYDLYPLAKGGPRAYRPSKQPDRRATSAAWFYGRLNMDEALRAVGVPLPGSPATVTGGIGGGAAVDEEDPLDPAEGINEAVGDLRRVLMLNTAVLIAITLGLAGIAYLIRRRTS